MNQQGYGVQYVMDRDGKVFRTLPEGAKGAHIRHSEINDLTNSNSLGMEVIAKDDKDVTPAQVASGKAFLDAMSKKYPGLQVFGHGEVNPSRKQATEGHSIVEAFRAGRAAPATDPKYKPPVVPLAQRTLGTYMGRDPVASGTLASDLDESRQHAANTVVMSKAHQRHAFPWQHRDFADAVRAAKNHAAVDRIREEVSRGADGPRADAGLGLDKLQRADPRDRIQVSNSSGSNLHVTAVTGSFG